MFSMPHLVLQNNNIYGTITIGNNPKDVDLREADLHNVAISFRRQLQRHNKAGPVILPPHVSKDEPWIAGALVLNLGKLELHFWCKMIQCSKFQTLTPPDDPKLENRRAVSTETRKIALHAAPLYRKRLPNKYSLQKLSPVGFITLRALTAFIWIALLISGQMRNNRRSVVKEISMLADLLDYNKRTT